MASLGCRSAFSDLAFLLQEALNSCTVIIEMGFWANLHQKEHLGLHCHLAAVRFFEVFLTFGRGKA